MFDSPRFWLLIQSLNLAHIKVDEGDDPLLLFNCLSNTLKKLRNLVALVITVDSLRVKWCTCGDLFEGSTFQLRIYGSGFILDRDHTAFLTHQPLILDWNWMPGPGSTHRLPSETMPNLTVLTTGSFVPELREIITGRPITHIDVGGRVITNISELATGSLPLKVLLMFCWDRSTPRSICRFFPSLKRFGWLSYGSQLDEDFILLEVLPRLRCLHMLEIIPEGDDLREKIVIVEKLHAACPSLRQVLIRNDKDQHLYEWDETIARWQLKQVFDNIDLTLRYDWAANVHQSSHRSFIDTNALVL